MPTTLFWTDDESGELDSVQFDVTTSEEPTDTVSITEHPVEEGADITDHVRKEPELITVEGYITNTPHPGNIGPDDDHVWSTTNVTAGAIGPMKTDTIELDVASPGVQLSETGLIQAGISALGSLVTGGANNQAKVLRPGNHRTDSVSAKVFSSPSGMNRARRAYDKLLYVQQQALLVTVVAEDREYFDMVIERLAKPRATGDGTAVKFQLDLHRIRIASSQTVESPQPAQPRAAATRNLGAQSTTDDAKAAQKESILHTLLN